MSFARPALAIALLLATTIFSRAASAASQPAASLAPPPPPRPLELQVDAKFAPMLLDHRAGEVRAVALLPDGRALVGGSFTFAANSECRYLACFARDGALDRTFAAAGACDGPVSAIRVLPDGRVLVAGFFRTVAGQRAAGLVRLLADGSVDPAFHPPLAADGPVMAIDIAPDGKILLGGWFTRLGEARDTFLVRLQPDGALDTTFRAGAVEKWKRMFATSIAATSDGSVAAVLAVDDGLFEPLDATVQPPAKILSETSSIVAKFLPDGRVDPKFQAQRTAAIAPRCILALPGGDFLIGGRGGVQRIGVEGLIDGVFRMGESGRLQIEALAHLADGRFVAAGSPIAGATAPARLLVLGPTGAIEARLISPRAEQQYFLAVTTNAAGNVLAAGLVSPTAARVEFSKTTNRIVRLDRALASDGTFRAAVGSTGRMTALAVHPDGSLTAGGIFLSANGDSRTGLVHLKPDGSVDRGFDPGSGMNAAPRVLVPTADGGVVAAGLLERFDDQSAKSVVRIRANGTIDWDFAPDIPFRGTFTDSAVLADGTFILVGQLAGRTADATFLHVVRLDPAGKIDRGLAGAVRSWLAPGAGSILTAAATESGHVLFGGEFSVMQGRSRTALARIGGEGMVDPAFVPETEGFLAITKVTVLPDRKIFAEGWRKSGSDGIAKRALIRLLPDGKRDTTFTPPDFGESSPLVCAALSDGTVVVALRDGAPDAASMRRLVRLDRDGSLMPGFNVELGNSRDLLQLQATSGGTVYLFGAVPSIGGQPRYGFARLVPKQ